MLYLPLIKIEKLICINYKGCEIIIFWQNVDLYSPE